MFIGDVITNARVCVKEQILGPITRNLLPYINVLKLSQLFELCPISCLIFFKDLSLDHFVPLVHKLGAG